MYLVALWSPKVRSHSWHRNGQVNQACSSQYTILLATLTAPNVVTQLTWGYLILPLDIFILNWQWKLKKNENRNSSNVLEYLVIKRKNASQNLKYTSCYKRFWNPFNMQDCFYLSSKVLNLPYNNLATKPLVQNSYFTIPFHVTELKQQFKFLFHFKKLIQRNYSIDTNISIQTLLIQRKITYTCDGFSMHQLS